ncbi:hypothetical protein ABPG75_002607 [Micractinium tetrahymenae]
MDHDARSPGFSDLPHALQALVFGSLSARTLALASGVSRSWRSLALDPATAWAGRYSVLWQPPTAATAAGDAAWQRQYGARQELSRCWLGRPATDKLAGHSSAVKTCVLLPRQGVLLTGGVDRTLIAWDLSSGVKLAASRPHAGTVRCIAADDGLLASGSSDHRIRVWLASASAAAAGNRGASGGGSSRAASALPFDPAGERAVLAGHAGPVSSVQLAPDVLISGSWDCTIRLWDRGSLECTQLVQTDDWVGAMSLRAGTLAAACGKEVLIFRLAGGELHRAGSLACPRLSSSDNGSSGSSTGAVNAAAVTAVECSADGRSLFVGTADGGVWIADLSSLLARGSSGSGGSQQAPRPALLQQQSAEVASLSWDHPWLAVADRSGAIALLDCGAATAAGAAALEGGGTQAAAAPAAKSGSRSGDKERRQQAQQAARTARVLHASGMGGAAAGAGVQCVCLAGSWAAAGLDCGTVISWDGSKGLQQQAAAAAARQAKAVRRQRNQERHAAQQQQRGGGGGSSGFRRSGLPLAATAAAAQLACTNLPEREPDVGRSAATVAPAGEAAAGCSSLALALAQAASVGQAPAVEPAAMFRPSSMGRMRVPPPPRPEAVAAAAAAAATAGSSSCRQQAWQVLRPARVTAPSSLGPASPDASWRSRPGTLPWRPWRCCS